MELNAGDLSFNEQEIRSLFAEVYRLPLSSQDLRRLEQQTEGWIIGLQWMAEALRGKGPEEVRSSLDRFKGSRGYLFHYLNEEVFQGLPAELQRFLKQSSILERFSTPLSASLLEIKDASRLIDALLKQRLFLIGIDPEGHWYRYHPLFRDFLMGKLEREEGPDVVRGLHRKAAHC